jgi:hypothetical protein
MTTEQLLDYIKQAQARGISREQIKGMLMSSGWNEADIEEGLSAVTPTVAWKEEKKGHGIFFKFFIALIILAAIAGVIYYFKPWGIDLKSILDKYLAS